MRIIITRGVKTGYPARDRLAHVGLRFFGPDQKGPDDKRVQI